MYVNQWISSCLSLINVFLFLAATLLAVLSRSLQVLSLPWEFGLHHRFIFSLPGQQLSCAAVTFVIFMSYRLKLG